jgi:hypothetical protein
MIIKLNSNQYNLSSIVLKIDIKILNVFSFKDSFIYYLFYFIQDVKIINIFMVNNTNRMNLLKIKSIVKVLVSFI